MEPHILPVLAIVQETCVVIEDIQAFVCHLLCHVIIYSFAWCMLMVYMQNISNLVSPLMLQANLAT